MSFFSFPTIFLFVLLEKRIPFNVRIEFLFFSYVAHGVGTLRFLRHCTFVNLSQQILHPKYIGSYRVISVGNRKIIYVYYVQDTHCHISTVHT